MKTKHLKYLIFTSLFWLMSCSLFKKIPDNSVQGSNISISWDDSDYNYDNTNDEAEAKSTIEIDEKNTVVDSKFNDKYSKILRVELTKDLNKDLVIECSEWIGTKYRFGASQKQRTTDCSGFVRKAYEKVYGVQIPFTSLSMHKELAKIDKKDLQEGDLVFFNINKKHVSHVGIYLFDNYFIHASVSRGVMVSSLDESYYKKFYHSAGRAEK